MVALRQFPTRAQSSFKAVETMEELIASDVDAIHWIDPPERAKAQYLQDVGGGAYIYKLHDAVFYPDKSLPPYFGKKVDIDFLKGPENLWFRSMHVSLLLTGDGAIFSDSFGRNSFVPYLLCDDKSQETSAVVLPEVLEEFSEESFFCELFNTHFGHVLIDMPGRYWPLALQNASRFAKMQFFGDGPGGVSSIFDDVIAACGLQTQQLTFVQKPTKFAELYVPSRIAPLRGFNGPRFNALVDVIGKSLMPNSSTNFERKVFLSRSRLKRGMRSLCSETEIFVEDLFVRRGFEIFHPQELQFSQQIALAREAKWLAGLVGSQMHLAVFTKAQLPKMFRICPSFHTWSPDSAIMNSLGGSLDNFIASDFGQIDSAEINLPKYQQSWDISPDDLQKLEQQIDRWLAT